MGGGLTIGWALEFLLTYIPRDPGSPSENGFMELK